MNIFEISKDLEQIFFEIEENDGVITEELASRLEITQDEFKNKLDSYRKAYSYFKSQAETAKAEETRIAAVRKTYENRGERLKDVMLTAVQQYGECGKSGNKFVELADSKLYTRTSKVVELDTIEIAVIKDVALQLLQNSYNNYTLDKQYGGYNIDTFIEDINNKIKADYSELATQLIEKYGHLVTKDDLYAIKLNFKVVSPIAELLDSSKFSLMNALFDNENSLEVTPEISKSSVKTFLDSEMFDVTCANYVENTNLVIK